MTSGSILRNLWKKKKVCRRKETIKMKAKITEIENIKIIKEN